MSKALAHRLVLVAACFGTPSAGAWAMDYTLGLTGTQHQALFAVATDGDRAVAVGSAGTIMEGSAAGAGWTPAPALTPLTLLGVASRGGHRIAVGQGGTVLIGDGAGAWRRADAGTKSRLFNVALNARGQAVAVGEFGTILRSEDFGATWKPVAPDWTPFAADGAQPHLYDAHIDEAGVMTVAGEFGLILRSADGAAWQPLHKGAESIFALDLRADGGGFAVGQTGLAIATKDNGATWQKLETGTSGILLGVRSEQGGKVLIAGRNEMLESSDAGTTFRHVQDARLNTSWYQGVADAGAGKPWLVAGERGEILVVSK